MSMSSRDTRLNCALRRARARCVHECISRDKKRTDCNSIGKDEEVNNCEIVMERNVWDEKNILRKGSKNFGRIKQMESASIDNSSALEEGHAAPTKSSPSMGKIRSWVRAARRRAVVT